IEHPISAIRIVEAIAERSIGTCKGPVGWLPRVGAATDPKNRTLRFNAEWNGLSSGHECADSAQNLRAYNFEVALPQESDRNAVVQLGVESRKPGLDY